MKIYTIIAGVNGSGKSSLTGALKAERSDLGVIIDVDRLAASLGNPLEGGREVVRRTGDCLERGISFTQETTLSGVRTERTIQAAKERGYRIRLYYVGLDTAQESLRRIQNRVSKGGHDIPQADVIRRFASRFEDLARVLPYCDEAVFFDNDNGFREVAAYKNGELIPQGDPRPAWLCQLADYLQK